LDDAWCGQELLEEEDGALDVTVIEELQGVLGQLRSAARAVRRVGTAADVVGEHVDVAALARATLLHEALDRTNAVGSGESA
jgi:hypothetical protein